MERITRSQIPTELLLLVGLATGVARGALTVSLAATARLTTTLLAALAAAGLVLGWHRRPADGPSVRLQRRRVLWGGRCFSRLARQRSPATSIDDTATFLALADRILQHGRSIESLDWWRLREAQRG
jgi:hypothetical protein